MSNTENPAPSPATNTATENKSAPPRPALKAVRGTRDLLPDQTPLWNHVESTARAVFARYGFGEIRTPIFEDTSLFSRSVGEETDIVSKEMFTWEDRARAASEKAQSLTLRPENTAGVVRAYIEHKLGETGRLQKLYYIGPQFRRERPQRGRYRQFWQIGAEVIGPQSSGAESPLRDAELLEMLAAFLNELGIRDWRLDLNSVGSSEDRARYNAALREALAPIKHQLCPDNQRRADTNPLRVLDSKDEQDQALINALPRIADYLGEDSRAHFQQVLAALDACSVPYNINPRLVRGLDYYTRTTFEFTVTTGLGTQNALLGGGRYDGLSEMLGGPRAPGIGFAIGEDRLILTLQAQAEEDAIRQKENLSSRPESASSADAAERPAGVVATTSIWAPRKLDAYIAPLTPTQNPAALTLARDLRAAGLTIEVGDGTFKLRKSFDIADTLARHIILLGEDEAATNILTVKSFATGEQTKVPRTELVRTIEPS
jgi:histidyl-tRNA synthetase